MRHCSFSLGVEHPVVKISNLITSHIVSVCYSKWRGRRQPASSSRRLTSCTDTEAYTLCAGMPHKKAPMFLTSGMTTFADMPLNVNV